MNNFTRTQNQDCLNYFEKLSLLYNPVWKEVMNKQIKLFLIDQGIKNKWK